MEEEFYKDFESYKEWLISFVDCYDELMDYSELMDYLFYHEFTYDESTDDINRVGDALYYRKEFDSIMGSRVVELGNWFMPNPSVLEVLITFAIRIETDIMSDGNDDYGRWFYLFLSNLKLLDYDNLYFDQVEVGFIVDSFCNRDYNYDGYGGLFPLKNPRSDQRYEGLWGQMSAYLNENY